MNVCERVADLAHQLRSCQDAGRECQHGYLSTLMMLRLFTADQIELKLHGLGCLTDQALCD